MQTDDIARIVSEVLKRLEAQGLQGALGPDAAPAASGGGADADGVAFKTVDEAVAAAQGAQKAFHSMGLAARARIIKAMRKAAIADAERLARLAVEDTGMGRVEDKTQKNLLCAARTPGVEDLTSRAYTGDKGLTLVEFAPYGVVAAVTPSTNPGATVINNALSALAAGNAVVFAPHPAAARVSTEAMRTLSRGIAAEGGPRSLITTVAPATQDTTKALLAHPGANVNMVTGGPAIVRIAMTVGKTCKTIAAGPGNPPVVVDATADLAKAASDIIFGASFDNNVLCIAEKEVMVTRDARQGFLEAMRRDGRAFELSGAQTEALTRLVIKQGGRGCKDPVLNRDFVGRDAAVIAKGIGLGVPPATRLLWAEVPNDHPLVWTEQIMPVLPVTVVPDVEAGVELAYAAEGGNHHTAAMYSTDVRNLTLMARRMQCSIFVKNAPTLFGLGMGEGWASMTIGTPTGDGITKASHFARPLHCCLVGYFRIA